MLNMFRKKKQTNAFETLEKNMRELDKLEKEFDNINRQMLNNLNKKLKEMERMAV